MSVVTPLSVTVEPCDTHVLPCTLCLLQGYAAIFGAALEMADNNVDLPAFGKLKHNKRVL